MARPRRILYENALYHVTSRGNERARIFKNDKDREAFLRILQEGLEEHRVLCHAWVLMDNHYHLVVETPEKNLPVFMAHLNGVYTLNYNKRNHRVGHLFQGRYKAIHVDKDAYLKVLSRYVVLNPVRAEMVDRPEKYKWSNYRATAGFEESPSWLETDWILSQFGKGTKVARQAYRRYVLQDLDQEDSPWADLNHKLYLGRKEFLLKMESLVHRERGREVPKYQCLLVRPTMEDVLRKVARHYGIQLEEMKIRRRGRNAARDAAIYLLKKEYEYTLKEIGKWFGIGPSAVGNRWLEMKRRLRNESELAREIAKCGMSDPSWASNP